MTPEPRTPIVHVVEDDPGVRDSLAAVVDAMGLTARLYASADEYLCAPEVAPPGCLIVDVLIPGMSGIELYQRLLARGDQLPLILITPDGDLAPGQETNRPGVVRLLEKPYRPSELRDSIERAIASSYPRPSGSKPIPARPAV